MPSFMRDILKTLSYEPDPAQSPLDAAELSKLDKRLAGFVQGGWSRGRTTVSIQPGECSVWAGNPRDVPRLSPESCRTLIASIAQEDGNRILAAADDRLIPAAAVLARLKQAGLAGKRKDTVQDRPIMLGEDEIGRIRQGRDGLAVEFSVPEGADLDALVDQLRALLIDARGASANDDGSAD